MRWLLVVGLFALLTLLAGSSHPILKVAYAIGVVTDLVLLIGVLAHRLTPARAATALLALGLAIGIAVLVDVLVADDTTINEASYQMFRASVLISGIAFLGAGARVGSVIALAYVLGVVLTLVAIGTPPIGTDRAPGTLQVVFLLVGVVVIFRALTVRVRILEDTAQRATEVAALAFRDELTGLPNRREMLSHLQDAIATAQIGIPSAVLLFDLDHFKRVNDTLGHGVGDQVLQRTAALSSAALRDSDHVGRWGGEEFLAVLHGTDLPAAVGVADRTRQAMAQVPGPTGVTASFGVCAITPGLTLDAVLARADAALYAAKRAGRNQVWASDGDGTPARAAGGPDTGTPDGATGDHVDEHLDAGGAVEPASDADPTPPPPVARDADGTLPGQPGGSPTPSVWQPR